MEEKCAKCGKEIRDAIFDTRGNKDYHVFCFNQLLAEEKHGCRQCDEKALEIVRLQEANTGLHDGLRRVMQILLETLGSDHKLIGGLRTEIKDVVGV